MTDLRALREAAEKVIAEEDTLAGQSWLAFDAFATLANPTAIIALLDRLKEAEEAIKAIDRHNDHPGFFNADIENVIRAHLERHNNDQ